MAGFVVLSQNLKKDEHQPRNWIVDFMEILKDKYIEILSNYNRTSRKLVEKPIHELMDLTKRPKNDPFVEKFQ